ncbi:hypothetical protein MCUN1_000205 [Malassezia cuniculi]|uniref:4a-hydroxytetrahydrobiopterin dehydratase n=1 Tax=Malassezia cuniculi TaxID=948313 RepID=A0AAF0EQW8_9BASI|nr:hypothetical protein MCUN1_000205 [Malassezia cuniculi]
MSSVPSAAELAKQACVPCSHKAIREQGITKLSDERTRQLLGALEPGWSLSPQPLVDDAPDALHRTYTFRNFATAASFANALGEAAETHKHHPAILLEWGRVAVWWWSHSLNGDVLKYYIEQSNDPLLPHAWEPRYAWFRMAVLSEFLVQVPAFTLGIWAMWTDNKRAYPWLICYGTLASFTTLQCLATVLLGPERTQLSTANLQMILQNYIPFMLIPLAIAIDLGMRTTCLLSQHAKTA